MSLTSDGTMSIHCSYSIHELVDRPNVKLENFISLYQFLANSAFKVVSGEKDQLRAPLFKRINPTELSLPLEMK